jgi:uncharacterized protein YecT (DUF1311 family)
MTSHTLCRSILGIALLAACAGGHAADAPYDDMETAARQVCLRAPDYPPRDQPPATQAACDSIAAYFGIGEPVDYAKARACAYAGKDDDILAMIYANGLGVARNYGVARKAACDADGAPAEVAGRLKHLDRMEAEGPARTGRFEFCDDITSGLMMGYCAKIRSRVADVQRNERLTQIAVHWSNDSEHAATALLKARDAFVAAHDAEVDLGGTARAAMVIDEEEIQLTAFIALLERADAGRLAEIPPARAQAVDMQLNATWRRLKATRDATSETSVKLADIQAAQRAWLRYRDAWVALGQQAFPRVSVDTWLAVLTQQREKQLADLLADRR